MSLRKKLWFLAGLAMPLILALPAAVFAAKAQAYKVDSKASEVSWVGKKVTGQHNGQVTLKDGELRLDKGQVIGGKFAVDMNSITVDDLEGKSKDTLTGHLKSDDFFGTDKFPTATYEITKVEAKADGDNTHLVSGNLTIKGKTNPLSFPAQITVDGGSVKAHAKEVEIDRTLYNIRYGSGKFFDNLGDKTIYDKFILDISLVAKK